jgi:hypothetical protein
MVGVAAVLPPDFGGGLFRAVAAQDVSQHRGRVALVRGWIPPGEGLHPGLGGVPALGLVVPPGACLGGLVLFGEGHVEPEAGLGGLAVAQPLLPVIRASSGAGAAPGAGSAFRGVWDMT